MIARIVALLLGAVLLIGCEQGGDAGARAPKAEVGRVPATPQRDGDPFRGYAALLDRAAVPCGLPFVAYARLSGAHADAAPRLPGRTGRNAELPYPLTARVTASGIEVVTSNCLACHATPLDGELIMGLGNPFLDLTADPAIALDRVASKVVSDAERTEWRRWSEPMQAVAELTRMATLGTNPGHQITRALMAHRDPVTLDWSDTPLLDPPSAPPLPLSIPPWWNLGKKQALFHNAEGRGDQADHMAIAALLCADEIATIAETQTWLADVRAYLIHLKSPPYPYTIDHALAGRGQRVYRRHCKGCHGTPGEDGRYRQRVVALGRVGTDPALARQGFGESDRFIQWLQRSPLGERAWIEPALGYVAPPLDGVWATAPYLHNGSVPTLASLLDSRARPAYWVFDAGRGDTPDYDRTELGWAYRSLAHGKDGAMSWDERERIYDTRLLGHGNQGHTFGDALAETERLALIEYLKTL